MNKILHFYFNKLDSFFKASNTFASIIHAICALANMHIRDGEKIQDRLTHANLGFRKYLKYQILLIPIALVILFHSFTS